MSTFGLAKPVIGDQVYRLLLDAAPDAIVVAKQDGRIVLVNTQTERLFGYHREELLGQKVEVLLPSRTRRRHAKYRAAYFRHPTVRAMGSGLELYGSRKDGSIFPIDVSLGPLDAGGEMMVSSSIRDITERRRSEELASYLAAIVEASEDAIITESLAGKIATWNSGAERLYGYKAAEVVGRPLSHLITGGRADLRGRILQALRDGGHVEPYEITQVHRDGHLIETSIAISPVKDKKGVVIGVSVIARDITGQKRSEEALRQSEERFRLALRNAPVTVFNQDRKLRYTWINAPCLAWGKQDYLGRTDAEIVGGEEGARLTAIKRGVLRSGVGTRTETTITFEGETHYFDMAVEPLRDARGTLLGITCAASDITPTKTILLERERLIGKLQEALEEVKRLSGLLSICASCKRIANEGGEWEPMESYLQTHSQAKFSHGVCPDCLRKLYPEQFQAWEQGAPAVTPSPATERDSEVREAQKRDDRDKK